MPHQIRVGPSGDGEVLFPANASGYPHVSYGLSFSETCAKHVERSFRASRVFIIASGSLSRNTKFVQQLQDALAGRLADTRYGMQPHTLWSEILEVARAAKMAKADLLVTVGAGSLTDAAKIVATAMANDAESFDDLDKLHSGDDWSQKRSDLKAPTVPIVSIPTSLSGGEYSFLGGGTNDKTHHKHGFGHPTVGPALVILDAGLTITTPDHVWLQSGVRAVDHCVEGLCALSSTPASDADAGKGLKLLVSGLLRSKSNRLDLEARHDSQMGVIEAMKTVFLHGIPMGASHGIGHQLGPLGVGHGETSCVMLPAVCRYNAQVNGEQQRKVCRLLWDVEAFRTLLQSKKLSPDSADLSTMLDVFLRTLEMPRSLKEVGVGGEKFAALAQSALRDRWSLTNPRPLLKEEDVLEILEMVRA